MPSISRRTFLAAGSAAIALPANALPGLAAGTDYKEAPSLRDRVAAGSLPPVKDRLPENPLVIKPVERVGRYGGDWNHALVGGGSLSMLFRYQAYEPLLRYTPDWSGVVPNVAESFEGDAEGKVYTIRLRKGMKWSDGQPFTTDDVKFWYDTVLTDKRVAFVGQDHWKTGGEVGKLEVIDAQTFKVTFSRPNGFFPLQCRLVQQRPDGALPQALPQAVPHRLQPRRERTRQAARLRKLGRLFPERRRVPGRQCVFPEFIEEADA